MLLFSVQFGFNNFWARQCSEFSFVLITCSDLCVQFSKNRPAGGNLYIDAKTCVFKGPFFKKSTRRRQPVQRRQGLYKKGACFEKIKPPEAPAHRRQGFYVKNGPCFQKIKPPEAPAQRRQGFYVKNDPCFQKIKPPEAPAQRRQGFYVKKACMLGIFLACMLGAKSRRGSLRGRSPLKNSRGSGGRSPPEFRGSGGRSPPEFRGSGGRSPPEFRGCGGRSPPRARAWVPYGAQGHLMIFKGFLHVSTRAI